MDQSSSGGAAPAQSQRPAHRDMMFCHECNDEWYRDQHGLTCPECGSDFTEIIEENNDPRDTMYDEDDAMSEGLGEHDHHQHPHAHQHQQNTSQHDDPEEADISNFAFTQTAPGRFNVQATITRSVSPQALQGGMAPGSIGGFMSMLTGLAGATATARPQGQQPGAQQGQQQGEQAGQNDGQTAWQEASTTNEDGTTTRIRAGRFTYHGGARLYPRDANNPQPRIEPVDDITNVMAGLMAALGQAPPGSGPPGGPGPQGAFRSDDQNPNAPGMPAHPFLQLFTNLGLLGGNGQLGDFVYSQEHLDRIVSQLMEQTATSNAPGPASAQDIEALPRKEVTEDMLGPEHTAECSICMDEVNLGEQVTQLPCKHWFHHACVSAWLQEHDTCPHCRKGISSQRQEGGNSQTGASSPTSRTSQMPGAFNVSGGSGTPGDPFVVPGEDNTANNSGSGSAQGNAGPPRGWFS